MAILLAECAQAGCRLIFVTGDSSAAEAYAADVERQKIQERTSRGGRAKLLRGSVVFTGFDLYGYRPDREAGVYCVEESEAQIVRRNFTMCANDPTIRPYIEREIAQAAREKQQLEKAIKELEVQAGEARRRAVDLRRLIGDGAVTHENSENLSFDDQVLAVRALGVKVYANGDDPSGWRYVVDSPIEMMR